MTSAQSDSEQIKGFADIRLKIGGKDIGRGDHDGAQNGEAWDAGDHSLQKVTGSAVRSAIVNEALNAAMSEKDRIRILRDKRSAAVVIQVPARSWIGSLKRHLDGLGQSWTILVRDGCSREHNPGNGNREVSNDLASGRTVIGIAIDPDMHLPATLTSATDVRVVLGRPDGALLSRVMRTFFADEVDVADDVVTALDLDDIVAAMRAGSAATDVIDRLTCASRRRLAGDLTTGVPNLENAIEFGTSREFGLALAKDISDYKAAKLSWADCMKGGLLHGYHGTGKSLLAASIAVQAKVPLLRISPGGLFDRNSHLGSVVGALRELMSKAGAIAGAGADEGSGRGAVLVVFEEVEGLVPRRDRLDHRGRDWWMPIIDFALLACDAGMTGSGGDGVSGVGRAAGVFILATTNHLDMVEPAMLRANRLERAIEVRRPDIAGVANILRFHLGADLRGFDLQDIAREIKGATAAEIMAFVREARRAARAAGRAIEYSDLEEATRSGDDRSADLDWRIAVHEAAHAVATVVTGSGTLEYVTIRGRGLSGGETAVAGNDDDLPTLQSIELDAITFLAAGAAEESIVGSLSTGWAGAGADSSDLGRISRSLAVVHAASGLTGNLFLRADGSEAALAAVRLDPILRRDADAHMRRLHGRARELVERHRDRIVAVAKALVKRRHLDAAEVVSILTAVPQDDERVVRDTALEIVLTESEPTDGDDVEPLRPFE